MVKVQKVIEVGVVLLLTTLAIQGYVFATYHYDIPLYIKLLMFFGVVFVPIGAIYLISLILKKDVNRKD